MTALVQRAALAAITIPQDCADEMLREYTLRSELVHNGLNENDGISCLKPEATFYAFPNIYDLSLSTWELTKYLIKKHKVSMVPGSVFLKELGWVYETLLRGEGDESKRRAFALQSGKGWIMKSSL